MPTPRLTKEDVKGYKAIAHSFKGIKTDRFEEAHAYLQRYIDRNNRSLEPKVIQKVAAARVLLDVFSDDGQLKRTIKAMQESRIDSEIDNAFDGYRINEEENVQLKLFKGAGFYQQLEGLKRLNAVTQQANHIETVETAMNTFLEEEDFGEYQAEDSPIRALFPAVKTAAEAYRGVLVLERNAERRSYQDEDLTKKIKDGWEKESRENGNEIYAVYGNLNLGLKDNEQQRIQLQHQIEDLDRQILETQKRLDEEVYKKAKAKETIDTLKPLMEEYEKDLEKESKENNYALKAQELSRKKDVFGKAFKPLSDALNEFEKKPGENYLTQIAALQQEVEQAQREYNDAVSDTPRAKIEKLVKDSGGSNEHVAPLLDWYNAEIETMKEVERWTRVKTLVEAAKNELGNNKDAMYFIFGDLDVQANGFRGLQKQGKNTKDYSRAVEIKSELNSILEKGEDPFKYSGKGSLDSNVQTVLKGIDQKIEDAKRFKAKNPVQITLDKVAIAEKELEQVQKEVQRKVNKHSEKKKIVGEEAEKKERNKKKNEKKTEESVSHVMEEMQNKVTALAKVESELAAQAISGKVVKSVADIAKEFYKKGNKDIETAEKKLSDKKFALGKLKKKQEALDKAFADMDQFDELTSADAYQKAKRNLKSAQPKQEDSVKTEAFKEPYEEIMGAKVRNNNSKIAELQMSIEGAKETIKKAEEDIKAAQTERLLQTLSELKQEKDSLTIKHTRLAAKVNALQKTATKAANRMKPLYDEMNQEFKALPKENHESVYSNFYKQIETFRKDYNKCLREDYKQDTENKNSPEYKRIMTALKGFGESYEEFKALSSQEIAGKITALKEASENYTRAKNGQLFHWKPSPQRKWRLDFSDRITGFCKRQEVVLPELEKAKEAQKIEKNISQQVLAEQKNDPGVILKENVDRAAYYEAGDKLLLQLSLKSDKANELSAKSQKIRDKIEMMKNGILNNVKNKLAEKNLTAQDKKGCLATMFLGFRYLKDVEKDFYNLAQANINPEAHLENIDQKLKSQKLIDFSDKAVKAVDIAHFNNDDNDMMNLPYSVEAEQLADMIKDIRELEFKTPDQIMDLACARKRADDEKRYATDRVKERLKKERPAEKQIKFSEPLNDQIVQAGFKPKAKAQKKAKPSKKNPVL